MMLFAHLYENVSRFSRYLYASVYMHHTKDSFHMLTAGPVDEHHEETVAVFQVVDCEDWAMLVGVGARL